MDLSQPVILTDFPSEDVLYNKLLAQAARQAVIFQNHDHPLKALRVTVRPTGWWQALLRRTKKTKVWPLIDSPFEGLTLGVDGLFYMLTDDMPTPTVTVFETAACTQLDVRRLTDVLLEMCAPERW